MQHAATFFYAYVQVALVCLNTWQIANGKLMGALIGGFLISLVWTFNVKRAAFADWGTRMIYCTGAMAGTATGLLAAGWIYPN